MTEKTYDTQCGTIHYWVNEVFPIPMRIFDGLDISQETLEQVAFDSLVTVEN
jgi:hypothetical protein